METVTQQYEIAYTLKGGLVRSSASGKFEGNDYSPSVRINSVNVYEVKNEKTGFIDDVKQEVVFKIICPSNEIAGQVASSIKEFFKQGKSISVFGGLPNDQRVVTLGNPYDYFLVDPATRKKEVVK